MATFKAVNVDQLDTDLTNIASAIKTKSGISENLEFPNGFIDAVNSIAVGDEEVQNLVKKAQTHDFIQEQLINYKNTSSCPLFVNNPNITEIPDFDFSQVKNFYRMFFNCTGLLSVPLIDTSNGENFTEAFRNCTSLTTIPPLNTQKATTMNRMFNNYKGQTLSWTINTDNVTDFDVMFEGASNIEEVKLTSTFNGTTFYRTFIYCSKLKTISTLDLSNCINTEKMLDNCPKLENISFVPNSIKISISIAASPFLTAESVQSIIDGLAVVESSQVLTLHSEVKSKLTTEQLTTIANKNWSVA